MSLCQAGPALGLVYIWTIPGSLITGQLYGSLWRRRPFILFPGIYYFVMILVVLLVYSKVILRVATGSLWIVWSMLPVLQTMPLEFPGIKPREIAVLGGLLGTMVSLGFAAGPIIAGLLITFTGSLLIALLSVSIVCSCVIIVSGFMIPEAQRGRSRPT